MKKLTETQERTLKKIQENLKTLKESKDVLDYLLKIELKGHENRSDYEELRQWTIDNYNRWTESYENTYADSLREAKEENKVLATGNTATLKALEKAGYIEIINIGGKYPDKVKVLKEEKDEQ